MPEYRQLTRKNAHAYVVAGNRVARTRLWKPVCHYLFQKGPGELSKGGNAHVLHNAHSADSNDGDKTSHTGCLL
jgi:hypothetical protein